MKHVLLLTPELIPSAILCGHAPLTYLAERGKIEYRWTRPRRLGAEELRWADVIVFVRSDDAMSRQIAQVARRAGKYGIYVLDDDLLDIPEGLGSSEHYRKEETRAVMRGIMAECRCFLSPSRNLLEKYGGGFARAERIEEPAAPRPPVMRRRSGTVKIGFAGSTDRTGDINALLEGALRRILTEYRGRVTAEFFGARPSIVDEFVLRHIPYSSSYEEYARIMSGLDWDIALAPMPDTAFHRCKHYNKYIEYASYGIPGIYSDVEPYRWAVRDGENGLLCPNTEEAWYAAIRRLVEDDALRGRISQRELAETESVYSMESVASVWERIIAEAEVRFGPTREVLYFNWIRFGEFWRWVWEKLRAYGWKSPYYIIRKIYRLILGKE